jgi:hypothetical protein
LPSGVIAIARGPAPTVMSPPGALLARVIGVTVVPPELAT